VNEQQLSERLAPAIGEPPEAADAVRRLEAHLDHAAESRPAERVQPRGMALVAAALGLLLVGGLLATQAARARRAEPAPAASPAAVQPAPGCVAGAPDQLVVIDLAKQQLVAYDHGCTLLTTPVTTGKPSVPSSTGRFSVLLRSQTHVLTSRWPKDSPNWYPATTVHDYVAYSDEGDALHSAEWEPQGAFGPGSENGPYAGSTVHVPLPALDRLYAWVQLGTTVIVTNGASPAWVPS
jgi:lipoprotein-anchoring transpeptidase ErfK/SrfK